jgi:hypothetical protein
MAEFASKGVGGTALGLSIGALGAQVLGGGLGNLLGGVRIGQPAEQCCSKSGGSDAAAALLATASMMSSAMAAPKTSCCNEDHTVNRYEAAQSARIAELETEIKLRDANIYTDQKLLEVYKYFDGKVEGINQRLCEQSVWNATQTGTISCLAAQIAQLQGLTKLVIPNGSVCPGWGNVTVTPATTTATGG